MQQSKIVEEIVIAVDPALRRVEEILLWRNKFISGAVFTFLHFLFWLIQNFQIRSYCAMSCILLTLHLLDAYRAKKRREILRAKEVSLMGKKLISICNQISLISCRLNKLKQRNRLKYFLIMLVFWAGCCTVGVKIKGFYLSYLFFWTIFSVPAIIYYEVAWKLVSRALPILEQLDRSMKYERRSILDKSELLVDVKMNANQLYDEEETENEYLQSFELGDLDKMRESQRRALENLEDEDDEDDDDLVEDEVVSETQEIEYEYEPAKDSYRKKVKKTFTVKKNSFDLDLDEEEDDELNSMLPDETLPSINEMNASSYLPDSYYGKERVMRRKPKNRPSIMEYYGDKVRSEVNDARKLKAAEDIDETFDFLDEELNKYDN